ncbi:sugar nucleotide-binding protein [Candidatus Gottesmanbacteria bacterium]|nr:sugar nucleotide-binding protein [Candidatus Gottesmanbacteria bacterium]
MKTIALIAPTGMLGSAVYKEFVSSYKLILVYRDRKKLQLLKKTHGASLGNREVLFDASMLYQQYKEDFSSRHESPYMRAVISQIGRVDFVINCLGIIKPHSLKDPALTLFVNGVLPHILSNLYQEKLIHITTDCVFSGLKGAPYKETSSSSPNDWYGLSKSLGDSLTQSLVLRTSIIGPELGTSYSLLEWIRSQAGKTVYGFINHNWNGVTTKQFAKVCDAIIRQKSQYPSKGVYHIFSSPVTKYDIVRYINQKYHLGLTIIKKRTKSIDRRLASVYPMCSSLHIPSVQRMIAEI